MPAGAGVLEEGAPAAAHVEDFHARLEAEHVDRMLELAGLRGGRVVVRRGVEAVRVGTRRVQPGQEEVGRPVVVVRDGALVEAATVEQEAQPPEPLAHPGRRLVGEVVGDLDHVLEAAGDVDRARGGRPPRAACGAAEQRVERAAVPEDDARPRGIGADLHRLDAGRFHREARPGRRHALREGAQPSCPIPVHAEPASWRLPRGREGDRMG